MEEVGTGKDAMVLAAYTLYMLLQTFDEIAIRCDCWLLARPVDPVALYSEPLYCTELELGRCSRCTLRNFSILG